MKRLIVPILLFLLTLSLAAQGKPIITVMDFTVGGISVQEMRAVIGYLSIALFKTGKYLVIDVTKRDTLLKEMEFSAAGCSEEACQLKIGRMLTAAMIVVGDITKLGARYLLTARMLETETANTLNAADGNYASLDEIVVDLADFGRRLAGIAGSTGMITPPAASYAPGGTADIMVMADDGAEVFVNGVSYGKAPVLLKKLEAGRPIKLTARTQTKAGSLELTLEPGEAREVSLSLSVLTGNLYVSANESAVNIWIDGTDKGPLGSGLLKAIPVGTHRIELKGVDLYGEAQPTIVMGETIEAKVLVRPVGRLDIDAPEGVPIEISGESWKIERRGGGTVTDVPAGQLMLTAGGQGFIQASISLNLTRGKRASWRPYSGGAIDFAVTPASTLCLIDGEPGIEAQGSLNNVAPGTRNLVLRKPGYRDRTLTVVVSLGKSARVEVSMEKIAPAAIKMPDFGIGFGIDVRGTDASFFGNSGNTAVYTVSAGMPLTLAFVSPFAERVDVPLLEEMTFVEGEQRDLTIPSGRFSLPWIPTEAGVEIGSAKTASLKSEGSQGYLSPLLPVGQYRVSLAGKGVAALVTVRPDAVSEPEGYRANLLSKIVVERGEYAKQLTSKNSTTMTGIISLMAGIIGAAGSGAAYYLGGQAMTAYRGAPDTASAAVKWKDVELWKTLFAASAIAGAGGLGLSPFLLSGGPDTQALQRSIDALDEGIRALGK